MNIQIFIVQTLKWFSYLTRKNTERVLFWLREQAYKVRNAQ